MESIYLAALQTITGVGNVRIKSLINYFGSAEQAWQANKQDLLLAGFEENLCSNLIAQRKNISIDRLAEEWTKKGIKIVTITDKEYPELLSKIYNPPMALYYRGQLPGNNDNIAMVGSRKASSYGKNVAQMFAAELTDSGFLVVSGAARGIDTAAHQGALTKGGTVAVLGTGVDVTYPPENIRLLEQIAEQGCVLSEYMPGTSALPHHFPMRNRIISGLCRGVVVVEAAEKSGALITADYSLDAGRDVFAVPGSIFSNASRGTHRLIKQGAKLVEAVTDIIEEYGKEYKVIVVDNELNEQEKLVYNLLSYDLPISVEELVLRSNLITSIVTYILLQLELRGLAAECGGQRYVRKAREGIR